MTWSRLSSDSDWPQQTRHPQWSGTDWLITWKLIQLLVQSEVPEPGCHCLSERIRRMFTSFISNRFNEARLCFTVMCIQAYITNEKRSSLYVDTRPVPLIYVHFQYHTDASDLNISTLQTIHTFMTSFVVLSVELGDVTKISYSDITHFVSKCCHCQICMTNNQANTICTLL